MLPPNANGFAAWLQHFAAAADDELVDHFGCYDPRNMQTRTLTCTDPRNWAPHVFQPNASDVSAAVKEVTAPAPLQMVGLTEYYHETVCLLHFRWTRRWLAHCTCKDANATNDSVTAMAAAATAATTPATPALPHVHYTHGVPHLRLERLPHETLALIDVVSERDQRVHAAAYPPRAPNPFGACKQHAALTIGLHLADTCLRILGAVACAVS
jgi:hypothetical protein